MQLDSAQILFGLRFSSLTVKQNPVGSSSGKLVGGQVNKTLDIKGLAIYCGTHKGIIESTSLDDETDYKFWCNEGSESNLFDHLLHPFDVSVSLVFNRAGKLDGDSPQYSIVAELTAMVGSLCSHVLE
uniref:Uncharacterized protein LOC105135080 isoform X1 n=1 Tax=Rhizophora mucronata TaxID=61149 RepID=A0A2P2MK34_RHIMU